MNTHDRTTATLTPLQRHSSSDPKLSSRTGEEATATGTVASLARAAARELIWGLRYVSREVDIWRAHAEAITDPHLRADALTALSRKRGNIHGAALFWTLPDQRNRDLLEVLVTYEILADFLDCVSERGAHLGIANGLQLHLALEEALDTEAPISDYYMHHDRDEDDGYLLALVRACRTSCAKLPAYETVRPLIAQAAGLSPVLALNHEPDAERRDQELELWAAVRWPELQRVDHRELPEDERTWAERTAGASAWLTVLAMLALAAEPMSPALSREDEVYAAYLGWIAPAGAMLDSFGDIAEDRANGDHSYVAHYPTRDVALTRVSALVRRARSEARMLPGGARHSVIVACMVAFYLAKESVRTAELRADARALRRAGGPLVAVLSPVLRLWRAAYGQAAM